MFEDFDILDVLEQPTTMRSETIEEPVKDFSDGIDFSSLEFEPEPKQEVEEQQEATELVKPYTDKEAKENAEIVIDLLDTFNQALLPPLARWRITKKRGGKEALLKMQLVFEKELSGAELTEPEKRQVWLYNAYLKEKEEKLSSIPFTDDEKEKLVKSLAKYLKEKQTRVSSDLGFWGELAMIEGMKIVSILT